MKNLLIAVFFSAALVSEAMAANCKQDELRFNFSNLPVKTAFAMFADFAGLKPQIDQSIEQTEPMHFDCTNWRVAAEKLAKQYDLRLQIKNGVMYVNKR